MFVCKTNCVVSREGSSRGGQGRSAFQTRCQRLGQSEVNLCLFEISLFRISLWPSGATLCLSGVFLTLSSLPQVTQSLGKITSTLHNIISSLHKVTLSQGIVTFYPSIVTLFLPVVTSHVIQISFCLSGANLGRSTNKQMLPELWDNLRGWSCLRNTHIF